MEAIIIFLLLVFLRVMMIHFKFLSVIMVGTLWPFRFENSCCGILVHFLVVFLPSWFFCHAFYETAISWMSVPLSWRYSLTSLFIFHLCIFVLFSESLVSFSNLAIELFISTRQLTSRCFLFYECSLSFLFFFVVLLFLFFVCKKYKILMNS